MWIDTSTIAASAHTHNTQARQAPLVRCSDQTDHGAGAGPTFFGLSWFVWPHFFFLQFVPMGCTGSLGVMTVVATSMAAGVMRFSGRGGGGPAGYLLCSLLGLQPI